MIEQIGKHRPPRVFVREWIEFRDLDSRRVSERMERSEGTISKLLAAADVYNGLKRTAKGKPMKLTVQYLAELAVALDVEVAQLFRDPSQPTRDELLRGVSNEELTTALQLIEHTRTLAAGRREPVVEQVRTLSPQKPGKRAAAGR